MVELTVTHNGLLVHGRMYRGDGEAKAAVQVICQDLATREWRKVRQSKTGRIVLRKSKEEMRISFDTI